MLTRDETIAYHIVTRKTLLCLHKAATLKTQLSLIEFQFQFQKFTVNRPRYAIANRVLNPRPHLFAEFTYLSPANVEYYSKFVLGGLSR